MKRQNWGTVSGKRVELFTLGKHGAVQMQITNYGAALVGVLVPDTEGVLADVILGYDDLEGYLQCTKSLGVIVGRHANRIAGARFTLGGEEHQLTANDGLNHIHGGPGGFGKVVWEPKIVTRQGQEALELSYFSPHGEEGYPGDLYVKVTYWLTSIGDLRIDYWAKAHQLTVVNLTNHAYFNLAGQGNGLILDHKLQLAADFFTPIGADSLPTGEILSVVGTPFDFRCPMAIGQRIGDDHQQLRHGQGYDHNWLIRQERAGLQKAARVVHEPSGRILEVWTSKPGLQFYSGNYLDNTRGKQGVYYPKRSGFCLETQYFPNSFAFSHFPSPVLTVGERYEQSTIFRFGVCE